MVHESTNRRSARSNHRSRTIVVTMLVAAAGSFLASAALAHRAGPWLRDPLYADKERKLLDRVAALPAEEKPFVAVMFGSSRTSNGLRGTAIDPVLTSSFGRPSIVFNFGVPAAGPVAHSLYLRRLLETGLRPDQILFEILPSQLSGRIVPPVESNFLQPYRLSPSEAERACTFGFRDDTIDKSRLAAALPIYGIRLPVLGRFFPLWIPWNERADASRHTDLGGWQRPICDTVTPEQRASGIERARREYWAILQTLTFDGPVVAALFESLELCRQHGISTAVVLMPEGSEYRSWYPSGVERELAAFLVSMESRFGTPIINARTWLPDDAFSDSHHQLPHGADQFSFRLASEIVRVKRKHE